MRPPGAGSRPIRLPSAPEAELAVLSAARTAGNRRTLSVLAIGRRHPVGPRARRGASNEGVPHGRGDDRPQPKSTPRVHDRRHVRGRHRPDRHRDQVGPWPQGEPVRRLRPDRPRRGLAVRHAHRAVGDAATATTTRRSAAQAARPSGPDHPAAVADEAEGPDDGPAQALYSPSAAGPRSRSAWPVASSSTTAGATSPSATRGATSPASWPTSSAAAPDASPRRSHDRRIWSIEMATLHLRHGDAWIRQGPATRECEPRCRQASLNRRQNEVPGNRQSTLALAA